MASINGLPPSLIPGTNRTNKVGKKGQVKKAQNKQSVGQPSKVANAVA
ncbi:chromosome partitioning protein ParA, partial [Vibrio sp. 1291-1]|nr:chromosome partitioning protein ParA [Vibrio sp. 1291-1]